MFCYILQLYRPGTDEANAFSFLGDSMNDLQARRSIRYNQITEGKHDTAHTNRKKEFLESSIDFDDFGNYLLQFVLRPPSVDKFHPVKCRAKKIGSVEEVGIRIPFLLKACTSIYENKKIINCMRERVRARVTGGIQIDNMRTPKPKRAVSLGSQKRNKLDA